MIDARTYVVFLAAAFAAVVAPGPDIFYVLSRSLSRGKRIGSISALSIAAGDIAHTVFAVIGLAALLKASTAAFIVLKYVGALYLIYLGVRAIREESFRPLQGVSEASDWKVFRQGMLTNLSNPKAILFYVTFLPQFVNPARGHAQLQLLVLGISLAVLDVIFLVILAGCAGEVNRFLIRKPRAARRVTWAMGALLIGVGARLAFAERT